MRSALVLILALASAGSAAAQRRARIGPTVSNISIDEGATSNSFTSFGGSFAFLSGDDGEIGIGIARYGDLSDSNCLRKMTLYALESNYYPVGAKGIAPYAGTSVGVARVVDQDAGLLGVCTGAQPSTEIALAFGLGVRANIGTQAAAFLEGRFVQVPNSAINALEARANLSLAFGKPRATQMLQGTLGPVVGFLIRLGGPMEGRAPTYGLRFRRDTKKSTLGLQIDYAQLQDGGTPNAILFAPGVEPSLRPAWGRLYLDLGLLLVGVPSRGPDRGMAQGAHGGIGADIVGAGPIMWNVNSRVLWFQRNSGENVFLVQTGVSISPKLESR